MRRSRILGSKAFAPVLLMMLVAPVWAQSGPPVQCVANAGVPPTLRAEGLTELVGDVLLQCSGGGAPLPAGSPVPQINVQVFLNTNVTSRLLGDSLTEALLLIDDPLPENQYIAAGGEPPNTVGCEPSPTCPNVFYGRRAGPNSLIWYGIPFQPATQRIHADDSAYEYSRQRRPAQRGFSRSRTPRCKSPGRSALLRPAERLLLTPSRLHRSRTPPPPGSSQSRTRRAFRALRGTSGSWQCWLSAKTFPLRSRSKTAPSASPILTPPPTILSESAEPIFYGRSCRKTLVSRRALRCRTRV